MTEQDTPTSRLRHLDRRAVVRAGAWTVPVVTLAAAAPAMASSGAKEDLIFNNFTPTGADYVGGKPTSVETNFSIRTSWVAGGQTLTSVTVMVSFPDSRVTGGPATILSSRNWTAGTPTHDGSTWTYPLVWTGSLPPSGSTSNLRFRAPLASGVSGSFHVTGVANATGATSATATATAYL